MLLHDPPSMPHPDLRYQRRLTSYLIHYNKVGIGFFSFKGLLEGLYRELAVVWGLGALTWFGACYAVMLGL